MTGGAFWVAELTISDPVAEKIQSMHHLDPLEIRDAVLCQSGLIGTWNNHPERGWRLIVRATIGSTPCYVVLYPAGDDCYRLGSAYPEHS